MEEWHLVRRLRTKRQPIFEKPFINNWLPEMGRGFLGLEIVSFLDFWAERGHI
jgi:hypothetical protein